MRHQMIVGPVTVDQHSDNARPPRANGMLERVTEPVDDMRWGRRLTRRVGWLPHHW
jgi:hypothetical protein